MTSENEFCGQNQAIWHNLGERWYFLLKKAPELEQQEVLQIKIEMRWPSWACVMEQRSSGCSSPGLRYVGSAEMGNAAQFLSTAQSLYFNWSSSAHLHGSVQTAEFSRPLLGPTQKAYFPLSPTPVAATNHAHTFCYWLPLNVTGQASETSTAIP